MTEEWRVTSDGVKILDYATAKLQSVPYKPSSRWLFYQLVQAGLIPKDKSSKFDYLLSRARKSFYGQWRPDSLADTIRECDFRGDGYCQFAYQMDTNKLQQYYVQLWFEAEAMLEQFKHYTSEYRVSLVPFRGDCSIPIKWEIAKKLEDAHRKYGKQIKILYFGDFDPKGLQIFDSAVKDIKAWCKVPFEVERIGLTLNQAVEYGIPDNPNKPNTYQWEALDDKKAGNLIQTSLMDLLLPVGNTILKQENSLFDQVKDFLRQTESV